MKDLNFNNSGFNNSGLSESNLPGENLRGHTVPGYGAPTYVTHSKFFSACFNAAIFDGPIRIYFAQFQESVALKLYFNLQERYGDVRKNARGIFKEKGRNIFVMLYPDEETFDACFDGSATGDVICDRLGDDYVLGVRGQVPDSAFDLLFTELDSIVRS